MAEFKDACYWAAYFEDMGARIPFCRIERDGEHRTCVDCQDYHSKYRLTIGDKIRAMTDIELAEFIDDIGDDKCPPGRGGICASSEITCPECWLAWLRLEARL